MNKIVWAGFLLESQEKLNAQCYSQLEGCNPLRDFGTRKRPRSYEISRSHLEASRWPRKTIFRKSKQKYSFVFSRLTCSEHRIEADAFFPNLCLHLVLVTGLPYLLELAPPLKKRRIWDKKVNKRRPRISAAPPMLSPLIFSLSFSWNSQVFFHRVNFSRNSRFSISLVSVYRKINR